MRSVSKKMQWKKLCILLIFAGLSSCATLTNSRITAARIIISHPATLVINGDTLDHQLERRKIILERDSIATEIAAFNDSLSKTIQLLPVNSFSYLMNAYPGFWPGFWVDRHSKKKVWISTNNIYQSKRHHPKLSSLCAVG